MFVVSCVCLCCNMQSQEMFLSFWRNQSSASMTNIDDAASGDGDNSREVEGVKDEKHEGIYETYYYSIPQSVTGSKQEFKVQVSLSRVFRKKR